MILKKETILIVHNYYQVPGGEDSVVMNEKTLLEKHGHKVYLYTRHNDEFKHMGVLRKLFAPINNFFNISTYRDVRHYIKKYKIDVVHVHNTMNIISPAVYYAAIMSNVPIIKTIHNFRLVCPSALLFRNGNICEECINKNILYALKYRCYKKSFSMTLVCIIILYIHRMIGIYKRINYICLTEFNKGKLLTMNGVKKENIYIKPNFVEQSKEYIDKRENVFVYVGRLDETKGVDFLLHTWKHVNYQLLICGTGPLKKWCEEYIKERNINAKLLGYQEHDKVMKILASSQALIMPTKLYEGFPMNIVEAYSVGTPVICSDLGNAGALINTGVTGYKFKNEEELIEAVNKVKCLHNRQEIKNIFLKNYSDDVNYKKMLFIYRDVIRKVIKEK